jgi:D-glycero-alpha-D-manno-heptose-7-phosphate kinase
MIFYCPGNTKFEVMAKLSEFGGQCKTYQFVDHGLTTWTI